LNNWQTQRFLNQLAEEMMSDSSFQQRVWRWVVACFPQSAHRDVQERAHRFLEEALELAQANGCSPQDAHDLVDYVFGRDQGDVLQETGGVLVTLAALCNANGVDMSEAGERELDRNWMRIDLIRAKQAMKPLGSALPQ
jgi:NTP pyrophosphatase (non-canonical NTP hydrolase)